VETEVPVTRIDDPDDPRIAAYRNIRERDLVRRDGLFIAEGSTVLNAMLGAARFPPQSILVLENRLTGFIYNTARRVPASTPVYVANRRVIDTIAGFPMHRGVLAIGKRPGNVDDPAAMLKAMPPAAVVVGAIGISNHDNMGAIFRNAAAFGADAVLLDKTACDPLYRKSVRVSVGGVLKVPFARCGDAADLTSMLAQHGFRIFALSPNGNETLDAAERRGRVAILLGTEGEGLPPWVLNATHTVRIPMVDDFDSLNVATAGAIVLSRLFMERSR
jgi:tRNA G18 (ribose-2'-O)-methylase SpoU